MSLLFDNRPKLVGQPAVHALIAGVSSYRHLAGEPPPVQPAPNDYGLKKLSSTALAADRFYRWLIKADTRQQLPKPLGTCRLLLSPSLAEASLVTQGALTCTLSNFRSAANDWRKDAATDSNNVTLFYFAGHGIEGYSRGESILLMEDFGEQPGGIFEKAVRTKSIYYGMTESTQNPSMARTQFYFIDACRVLPIDAREFETLDASSVWPIQLADPNHPDNRTAPIFYATVSGALAYEIKNGKQTIFSKALIQALEGAAAQPPEEESVDSRWEVTYQSLAERLKECIRDVCYEMGLPDLQKCRIDGVCETDASIVKLGIAERPTVDCNLTLEPDEAAGCAIISCEDCVTMVRSEVKPPITPYPYRTQLSAGFWQFGAKIDPSSPLARQFTGCQPVPSLVRPPRFAKILKVR